MCNDSGSTPRSSTSDGWEDPEARDEARLSLSKDSLVSEIDGEIVSSLGEAIGLCTRKAIRR